MHSQRSARSLLLLAATVLLLTSPLRAADAPEGLSVDGRRVTVRTPRFVVEFDGLAMTRVENRLTGEVYAQAPAAAVQDGTGIAIESLRPAVPVKVYGLCPRTRVESAKALDSLTVSYTGLQCGEDFDPKMSLSLTFRVDPKSGDLVLQPAARAEIEEVFGVRDRGVLHCALRFGPLDESLRLIIPASDGFSVTREDVPADWRYDARWPQTWEAALVIAEGAKGCLGLWADEPQLHYGRLLSIRRQAGWNITLAFETAAAIYHCTEMKGAAWRFNVFDGYWVRAADRYVQQMEQQWPDLQRLDTGKPAWADKIRIFLTGPTPGLDQAQRYAALVPRDSIGVFTCQEWLKGWNDGAIDKRKVGMDYFPNWPLDNPDHYEGTDAVAAKFKELEPLGIHIFPYTNPTIVTGGHPWLRDTVGPRAFLAYKFWQRFHPEFCQQVVRTYGVSGIYEDCSWVVARHSLGEPDGDNWYNGSVHMRQYFRQLLPEIAVTGERNNEVTCRGQKFALSITQWGDRAHPINARIFGPFLRMWNLQLQPAGFDADDIRGWLTPWPSFFEENPIQERLMLRKRGIVFAKEQLKSYWPPAWDPRVMHYFKAADGTEYRFVRDRGTRFVKMGKNGEETIYWRLHGVPDAVVGKAGVEGWVGYGGDRIVGLNPQASYVVLDEVKRPAVVVSAMPEDCVITRSVVREKFWVISLQPAKAPAKDAAPVLQTLRVRAEGGLTVAFCGAESAAKAGEGEYEVKVKVPGGFGAYWGEPVALQHGEIISTYPAQNTIQRRDSGLLAGLGPLIAKAAEFNEQVGDCSAHEEGTVPWLVKIPEMATTGEDTAHLVFEYGSQHPFGDGADYRVRVNGQEVWHRYRPETKPGLVDKAGQSLPVPLQTGAVNLTRFAGQTVVLELAADGHLGSVSEAVSWHRPRLQAQAPGNAESDDTGKAPVQPNATLNLPSDKD